MVYVKSLGAGIIALVIATILSPFIVGLYLQIAYPTRDVAVGWDPVSFAKWPPAWFIGAAIFMTGFLWEFRRTAK
jgi:hypothetical protein